MDRSKWEHLIPEVKADAESGRIICIEATEDGEIQLLELLGHYTISTTVTAELPYYYALLEVVGPLEPGDSRSFIKIPPTQETFTAKMVAEALLGTDIFERLEVDQDGGVRIFCKGDRYLLEFSANSRQQKMLDRHFGPLKPGDVIDLRKAWESS